MLNVDNVFHRYDLSSGFFGDKSRHVYAVNGVSLQIGPGEIYGLVGESGSGKTSLARMIVGLVPTEIGSIELNLAHTHQNRILKPNDKQIRKEFQQQVRYVFQDPARSLNPRLSVQSILYDSIRYTDQWKGRRQADVSIQKLLSLLQLESSFLGRSPIALSGGQRQRLALARALLTRPKIIICDEIVSSLDTTVRRQILNVLLDIRKTYDVSILFIAHDLSNVLYIADRIGVMYRGVLVEEGSAHQISFNSQHRYTHRLYESIPKMLTAPQITTATQDSSFDPTTDATAYGKAFHSSASAEKRISIAKGHSISARYNGSS